MTIQRIHNIQRKLSEHELAGAIIFHSRDIYYFTGTAQPGCLILKPNDYRLFIQHGMDFALREAWLPAEQMAGEGKLEQILEDMFPGPGKNARIGAELDLLPVITAQKVKKMLGQREMVDFSPAVLELRAVKDEAEIGFTRKACEAVHAGHQAAISVLKPGITELELSAAIENAHRLAGHEGLFFMRQQDFVMGRGPLASGPNLRNISGVVFSITGTGLSPAVPAGASRRRILEGNMILVDIPTCTMGYHADQSRMYALGKPSGKSLDAYDRLRAVADYLIDALRPGQTCNDVFSMAVDKAEQNHLADSFLRFPSGNRAHFVGHGVGLELNEPPLLAKGNKETLRAGMVLALEMHIMEKEGFTLKLEDTVRLTETGCQVLTVSPRDLIYV